MPWPIRLRSVFIVLPVCLAALVQAAGNSAGEKGKRAASRVLLGKNCSLEYAGAFVADGSFKGRSRLRLGEFVGALAGQGDKRQPPNLGTAPEDAAPSKQRVVEDYEPGAHPVETVNGRPVLADMVDAITSFAEEHQAVMDAPRALATDSSGRLIVADPPVHAVHVLDFKEKTSFRIQGGKDRRLRMPAGVAADRQGNIYVSDSERGMILVYDRLGRFRHYLGRVRGEAFFERPEGVAVDDSGGRIYVADTARNSVSVLDLRGGILATFGGKSRRSPEFTKPTSLVLVRDQLYVLDSFASRVQVMDLQGNIIRPLRTPNDNASPPNHAGLAVDSAGNLYISDEVEDLVRVYTRDADPLASFGKSGGKIGEFGRPLGLWVDARGRLYIADSKNHRVQVFQIRAGAAPCQ